jgi:hypothetical protein
MVMPEPVPVHVAHRRAVHEHEHLARGARKRAPQRLAIHRDGASLASELHLDGERVGRRCEVVAQNAVERRDHRFRGGRRRQRRDERLELTQGNVDGGPHRRADLPHAPVDDCGRAETQQRNGIGEHLRTARDRLVHGFHQISDAARGIDGEPADAAEVQDVFSALLCHFAFGPCPSHTH